MYKFIIKFRFIYWDDSDDIHRTETMTFIEPLSLSEISDEYIQKICQDKLNSIDENKYPKFSHIKSIKQIKTFKA